MSDLNKGFSPREFLRDRQAVLVHFSTVMTAHPELVFPDDLIKAMTLVGVPLSFSTIQRGDTNPHRNGPGGEGSVGLLVDIGNNTIIKSVSSGDSGSNSNDSLGWPPNRRTCAESIDKRETSNEWHIQDYVPIGIFVWEPVLVRKLVKFQDHEVSSEVCISLKECISKFPDQRIFSVNDVSFLEYNRANVTWIYIEYDAIFSGPQ
jgi:hypothetical protein